MAKRKQATGATSLQELLDMAMAEIDRLKGIRPQPQDEFYPGWLKAFKLATSIATPLISQHRQYEKQLGEEFDSDDELIESLRPLLTERGWFPPDALDDELAAALMERGWRPPFGQTPRGARTRESKLAQAIAHARTQIRRKGRQIGAAKARLKKQASKNDLDWIRQEETQIGTLEAERAQLRKRLAELLEEQGELAADPEAPLTTLTADLERIDEEE